MLNEVLPTKLYELQQIHGCVAQSAYERIMAKQPQFRFNR
jgi:hypothetical protein